MYYLQELHIIGFINDQDIYLNFDNKINILIGKNGCGKTTIFRIIDKLLDNDFSSLIGEPFKEIYLKTTKSEIRLKRTEKGFFLTVDGLEKHINLETEYSFDLDSFLQEKINHQYTSNHNRLKKLQKNHIFIPLTRSYSSHDIQKNFNRFSLEELQKNIEKRYRIFLMQIRRIDDELKGKTIGIPLEINNEYNASSNFQRILNFDSDKQCKIRTIFKNLDYAPTENLLDTLFEEIEKNKSLLKKYKITSHDKLIHMYITSIDKILDDKIKEITSLFNFINREFAFVFLERLLELFKTIEEKKKKTFTSFKSFEEILNSFFSENRKKIQITSTGELKIESLINRNKLDIYNLSSGEKQLVTLFGYLIFDTRKEKIILIDEPELSLHIDWQMKFTESLMNLDSEKQYFLATHSPEIIGDYDNKCIWIGETK